MPTLQDLQWPRSTPRLLTRPATPDDAPATWRIRCFPGVSDWLVSDAGDLAPYTAAFVEPGRLSNTLIIEMDRRMIGDLSIVIGDGWAQREVRDRAVGVQAELGWVLDPAYGGRGLATEAVVDALQLCLVDLGLRRVTAGCFADNTASWRLMERVGMRREIATVAESLHRSGRWLDGLGCAILADEWTRMQTDVTR